MTDEEIVAAMADYTLKSGFPPSVREVAAMAGYASPQSGHTIMLRLESKGLIERVPGIPRGIKLKGVRMKADTETF